MLDFFVTAINSHRIFRAKALEGDKEKVRVDFSPWAEDNEDVSSVEWTVKAGTANIQNESYANNIGEALISLDQTNGALIEVKAITANLIKTVYVDMMVYELNKEPIDYAESY